MRDLDYGQTFSLTNINKPASKLCYTSVRIEGSTVQFIADTGSTVNIVDMNTYRSLNPQYEFPLDKAFKKIFSFNSSTPLDLAGSFQARVSYNGTTKILLIFVVNSENTGCLLSKDALEDLGIISFNLPSERCNLASGAKNILDQFPEVTSGIGCLKDTKLKLHINPSVKPVVQPTRRVPFHQRAKVEEKIKKLENLGLIERVSKETSWLSPIHIVPKKHGDIRMVVDMRRANEAICRVRRPIPVLEDILYELNGATVFSTLDLNMGYQQIELDEESRDITTFTTHIGTYRYLRLIEGVNSATEEFQYLISQALSGCQGCRNISDDIVIFGATKEEHDANLKAALQRLAEKGLTVNREKCSIGLGEVTYFGYRINRHGIQPTEDKVSAIKNMPSPKTVSEVRSFLGMATAMSRFIENYSSMIAPLTDLTKKNKQFRWGYKEQEAFTKVKDAISSDKVLVHFDITKKSDVYTDGSPVGLGAILMQEGKPVLCVGRLLTDVETRYCQTEREALAIVWACERLHTYLVGNTFTLHTDHKPLLTLYGRTGNPSARILRWALRMQPYDFTVNYIKGSTNPADYLSRHPSEQAPIGRGMAEEFVNYIIENAIPMGISIQEMMKKSLEDTEIQEVITALDSDRWNMLRNTAYYTNRNEFTHKKGLLLRDNQIVMPLALRKRCLNLAHGGHLGVAKTKSLLRTKVWWPGMEKDTEAYVKTCAACQSSNPLGAESLEPLKMTTPPELPFTTVHVDLCGPWPSGDHLLTVVDQTSRYPVSKILRSTTTTKVIDALHEDFTTFGFPEILVSDNGPQFKSHEFQRYCRQYGIRHAPVTPLHPRANGEVERFFRTTKKTIRCAIQEGRDWKTEYQRFLFNYRDAKHATTGKSPSEIIFGYELRGTIPSMRSFNNSTNARKTKEALQQDKAQKEKIKGYADKHNNASHSMIKVGDKVLLKQKPRNKFGTPFDPLPFTVIRRCGNQITIQNNKSTFKRNVSHVKRFHSPEELPSTGQIPPSPKPQLQTSTWQPRPLALLPDDSHVKQVQPEKTPVLTTDPDTQTNDQRTAVAVQQLEFLDQLTAPEQPDIVDEIAHAYETDARIDLAKRQLSQLDAIEQTESEEIYPQIEDIFSLYRNDPILTPPTPPPYIPTLQPSSDSEEELSGMLQPRHMIVRLVDSNPTRIFNIEPRGDSDMPRKAKQNIVYYRDSDNSETDNTITDSNSDASYQPC